MTWLRPAGKSPHRKEESWRRTQLELQVFHRLQHPLGGPLRVHSRRKGAEQAKVHGARQAQVQRAITGETGGAGNDQIGFQATRAGRLDANFVAQTAGAPRTGIFKIHVGIAERDAAVHLQRFRSSTRTK